VKFSKTGSKITISYSKNKSFYKIRVADEGKGIPKRDLPHIFEGFYKGRDNTKKGMGLGLFLAENIVQRHSGFMRAESEVNKGTVIEVNLPIS
jgi:signal transduction histidine kinase